MIEHLSKAIIDNKQKQDFCLAYKTDIQLKKIFSELIINKQQKVNKNIKIFSKARHLFCIINRLIYNIYKSNKQLCVLYSMLKQIFAAVYNKKHYASPNRIIEDFEPYFIYCKLQLVKKYIECCPGYNFNCTDKLKPIGSLRTICFKNALPI